MVKRIFAVVLRQANEVVSTKIEENYPGAYAYTGEFYLIAAEGEVYTNDIAIRIGIKGENRIPGSSGVVFKLNTGYSGHTEKGLWEWLSSMDED